MVVVILIGCLTGCGRSNDPVDTIPPAPSLPEPGQTEPKETQPSQTEPPTTPVEDQVIGHEDTYWVAESWSSLDGEGADDPGALQPETWLMDLLVRADGTARFRDIRDSVCLMDDSYLELVWERTPEGRFLFQNRLCAAPVLDAVCENGVLTVEYLGITLSMQQKSIPQTAGLMYHPAELAGTWLMVFGETDGIPWEVMPGQLSSLVFKVTSKDGPLVLVADRQERDYYGELTGSAYWQDVAVLQEPLREGCENGQWCVRIGSASSPDTDGLEPECYATLLDYNTLLLRRSFVTSDGEPMVSYDTYARFPDLVTWKSPEAMDLDYTNWLCVSYAPFSDEDAPMPAELEGFSISLDSDGRCHVQYGDGSTKEGAWRLEDGGVILLRSGDGEEYPFWFAGAVSGYCMETDGEIMDAYEMALYYNGGIMKLVLVSHG